MKTEKTVKRIVIRKKNRKYFAATLNGYKCRLIIDKNSESLEPGEHSLSLIDESVKTKFGTDLIFRLDGEHDKEESERVVTLSHPVYNVFLHRKCVELGGAWDAQAQTWVFSGLVENEVEDLDYVYNSKNVSVEIEFLDDRVGDRESVYLFGYVIATAYGRDSGAKISPWVSLISGKFKSGGSVKNWKTIATEGTVIRMKLPEKLLEHFQQDIGEKEEYRVKVTPID